MVILSSSTFGIFNIFYRNQKKKETAVILKRIDQLPQNLARYVKKLLFCTFHDDDVIHTNIMAIVSSSTFGIFNIFYRNQKKKETAVILQRIDQLPQNLARYVKKLLFCTFHDDDVIHTNIMVILSSSTFGIFNIFYRNQKKKETAVILKRIDQLPQNLARYVKKLLFCTFHDDDVIHTNIMVILSSSTFGIFNIFYRNQKKKETAVILKRIDQLPQNLARVHNVVGSFDRNHKI